MSNRQVVGYLLQESAVTCEPVVLEDTGQILRFRAVFQDYIKNRNSRQYTKDLLVEAHNAERVQELLATRTMYGEQNHPFTKDPTRQIIVDMERASHMNVNFSFGAKQLTGVVETLAWAKGEDFRKSIVINKSQAAFSMRGVGDVQSVNGTLKVARLLLGAYDWVTFPSHKAAYMETTGSPLSETAYMLGVTKEEIQSMHSHLSESANVKGFIDQFGLERPEIVITEDAGHVTIKGGNGRKVLAMLESDYAGDFRNFLRSKK